MKTEKSFCSEFLLTGTNLIRKEIHEIKLRQGNAAISNISYFDYTTNKVRFPQAEISQDNKYAFALISS